MTGSAATFPSVEPIGLADLLVRFSDRFDDGANRAALAFRAALQAAPPEGVIETAPALVSVHVACDPAVAEPDAVAARLHAVLDRRDWYAAPLPAGRRRFTVPASFGGEDGPQLAEAARQAGMAPDAAIAALTAAPLRVLTLGFAPGQPYLGLLPTAWDLPRQTALTRRVPAGAIVVALRQAVIFAAPAPTGWQQVGRTALPLFRADNDDPVTLRPGDELRFEPVTPEAMAARAEADPGGLGGAVVEPAA